MKREIGVVMLLSAVMLSGCGADDPENVIQGTNGSPSTQVINTQPEQETNENITWTLKNNEVKISPVKVTDQIDGVIIEVNNVKKDFNWSFPANGDFKPQIFYTDVTGDGNEEAVIILNKGKGTSLRIDELHVLNSKDLSEIKTQNFEEIVADQVKTLVTKNDDDTLAIKVNTQGKEYEFSHNDELPDFDQDTLNFGGVVNYQLENQKIILTLGASVGISPDYLCDVHILYKFDNTKNEFITDQIEIETYD